MVRVHHHLLNLVEKCTTVSQLKLVQASLITLGLQSLPFLNNKLIKTLAINLHHHPQALPHALFIFTHANHSCSNTSTWNALLRGLCISSTPLHALHLFAEMLQSPFADPDMFSYVFVLKACARTHARRALEAVHGLAIKRGSRLNAYVVNTAVHAYALCGDIASARRLFDSIHLKDFVSWNAMIAGYVQNGHASEALQLFYWMWVEGAGPTDVTVISALSACTQSKNLNLGRQIHGFVSKKKLHSKSEINIGTALIDMYAKCGCLVPSKQVFDEMKVKDTGVWNALIAGCVSNKSFEDALKLFQQLQDSGLRPDKPTLVSTLCACSHLGALDVGKRIHLYVEERYPNFDATLGTALLEMYSRCGCIEKSRQVFDRMPKKDAMAWTSMIGGLAAHGHAHDALKLFSMMQRSTMKPDGVTFVGVLSACSHAGMVKEGLHYFNLMKEDYTIVPRVEHYGCMIDLFSRAGRLREAFEFIDSMEIRANAIIWRTFLSACRLNLDVEMAEIAVRNLHKLGSDHCGDYVLLSNIYTSKGRWDDARRIRKQMVEGGIRKKHAFSLIEASKQSTIEKPSWCSFPQI